MVTILIPVYNTSAYLKQCLDSIVHQTYKDLQVVVVDDGSTDDSWEICRQYAAQYSYVEVYHQENAGVAAARNNLLSHVKGEYLLFVDSDDWVEPDTVEYLYTVAHDHGAEVVACGMVKNNESVASNACHVETWNQESAVREFLRHVKFNGSLWNKLIRSDAVKEARFDRSISYGEDALFVWQVLQHIHSVVVTDRPLYHYRMNDGSISHQAWTPEKKGSGRAVWKAIANDTEKLWPRYVDIAKARFAIEDMWALYFAALSGYKYDEHICRRQRNVRRNLGLIRTSGLVSMNKVVAAYMLGYCYGLGRIFRLIH